jgi:hypothetical protein
LVILTAGVLAGGLVQSELPTEIRFVKPLGNKPPR